MLTHSSLLWLNSPLPSSTFNKFATLLFDQVSGGLIRQAIFMH